VEESFEHHIIGLAADGELHDHYEGAARLVGGLRKVIRRHLFTILTVLLPLTVVAQEAPDNASGEEDTEKAAALDSTSFISEGAIKGKEQPLTDADRAEIEASQREFEAARGHLDQAERGLADQPTVIRVRDPAGNADSFIVTGTQIEPGPSAAQEPVQSEPFTTQDTD
jgi:hypothetical protein